ncbi:hypothetical protein GEMRC1_013565 [Eukaryota sp. GEM-RC1]
MVMELLKMKVSYPFFCSIKSSSIQVIDLKDFSVSASLITPLLGTSAIKRLSLPTSYWKASPDTSPLITNSSLQSISFNYTHFDRDELFQFLICNSSLKKLEMITCEVVFPSLFKSLETNTSLTELLIHNGNLGTRWSEARLHAEGAQSLVEMLQKNTTLLVLDIDGSLFTPGEVKRTLKALEQNGVLQILRFFRLCALSCLSFVYEASFSLRINVDFDVSPHRIDIQNGVFCFKYVYLTRITAEEIDIIVSF